MERKQMISEMSSDEDRAKEIMKGFKLYPFIIRSFSCLSSKVELASVY